MPMELKLTGAEPGPQLVKQLVALRHIARRNISAQDAGRVMLAEWKKAAQHPIRTAESAAAESLAANMEELLLQLDFHIIEIGNYLMPLCRALDEKASREAVFDALNVGQAHRDTDQVRQYGGTSYNLVAVLKLENSNTEDYGRLARPLAWCQTMAFMHAIQTNAKLDRIVHDGANEFFGGAFGEYRERPLTERLAGRSL